MTSQDAYTPVSEVRSRRTANIEKREQHKERRKTVETERRDAIAEYLSALETVNSNVSLGSVLEIVYPKTTFGRFISPLKKRMISATTSHVSGKSTLGGWVDIKEVTGQYLLVEQTKGYIAQTENDENPHFVYDDVVLQDGRIGTLLKPKETELRSYSFGEESVLLDYYGDVFENRNCQAVWGPSLTDPDQLSTYQARNATQELGKLIVDAWAD